MGGEASGQMTLRYVTTPGWWAPAVLDLLFLPALIRAGSPVWWADDVVMLALLVAGLYALTHRTLRYSPLSFTLRRGPFRTRIDLRRLASVRALDVVRRSNILDPQTGERRSNIRWFNKYPDDWGGKVPIQGYVISDVDGHRMVLHGARSGAPWAALLLAALTQQPDVELGPRVVASLQDFAR